MSDFKVVVLDDRYDNYNEENAVLSELGVTVKQYYPASDKEAIEVVKDADGVLCNLFPLNGNIIRGMQKCKIISRYGVGFDNVDLEAANEKGILVCNVPDYAMEDVSDQALALLMGCIRKVSYKDRMIRDGKWNLHKDQLCYRQAGRVLGIVGFGHIGSTFCRKVSGFGYSKILVADPYVDEAVIKAGGGIKTDLDTLLSESDYVSVHCPLNEETTDMFDKDTLKKMKKGSILVNTARGPIVNEEALADVLQNGPLAGAGIDVFASEPLFKESPLRNLDNIIMSDHAGWYSEESTVELKTKVAQNVLKMLKGEQPDYPVNKV